MVDSEKPVAEVPAIHPLAVELAKLSPVPGEVLVLTCPVGSRRDEFLNLLCVLAQTVPEGVSLVALDAGFRLTATSAPELMAMLEKPSTTH